MVKHIILWKLRPDVADPNAAKSEAKSRLESLVGKIPGLISLTVQTNGLPTSTADMMLDSAFTDAANRPVCFMSSTSQPTFACMSSEEAVVFITKRGKLIASSLATKRTSVSTSSSPERSFQSKRATWARMSRPQ